ncbi:organic anion transporter 3-like [Liolophura sinensis]|uniref:organic anion transporter 3-like n=1 Tax=Liolophura sinensis TaxID=3198878 RepID=UPI003157FAC6
MSESFTEDEAMQFLERGGRWHWIQVVLLLASYISSVHATFLIIFTGFEPKFVCRDLELSLGSDENGLNNHSMEIFDNACLVYNATSNSSVGCDAGFRYDVYKTESIVSEWNLICDKAYLSEVSQMLFTVGSAIGAALVAPLSDRVGRRWTLIVTRLLTMLTSYAILFVPGITGFIMLRFLGGILTTGTSVVRGVYLSELTPLKFRPIMTTVSGTVWGVALCIQALIGYLMRGMNWRYFQALLSMSFFTIILDVIFIKESLIWLCANDRRKEASVILKAAMKTNGVTAESLFSNREITVPLQEKSELTSSRDYNKDTRLMSTAESNKTAISDEEIKQRRSTVVDMLKNPTTRKLLFKFLPVVACMWCLNNGTTKTIAMQVVTFIGKFGISATFILLYFYTTEVLPTNFRTTGLGIGSFFSKTGSCLSPFSSVLLRLLPWGPGVIFGGFCLVVALLFVFVPETNNRQLPQTVIEIEMWEKEKKSGDKIYKVNE